MKYFKYIFMAFNLMLLLPLSVFAYEYQNPKNKDSVERYVTDIDHLKEMYDDLIIEEEDCDLPSSTLYAECSGVTVDGQGTYSLEDYVAGVLAPEFSPVIDNDEATRAFGIVARTYVLRQTNNCKKAIESSSNKQNFDHNRIAAYRKYAKLSEGEVLTDGKKMYSVYYALSRRSDCEEGASSSTCTIKRCYNWADSTHPCTAGQSVSKLPTSSLSNYTGSTHFGGLEPYIAYYYATKENYNTEQILKHFFGNKIKISKLSGADNSEQSTGQDDSGEEQSNKTETTNNTSSTDILVDKSKYKLKTKKLMVTTYTGTASENGGYAGQIALSDVNGGKLADGMVAVRLLSGGKTWLPYHTVIYVETKKKGEGSFANGKFFYVADNGGLRQNEQIDVYCAECDAKHKPGIANSAPYGTYYNGKLYIVEKNVSWNDFLSKYYTKKAVVANSTESDSENSCTVDDDSSDGNSEYINVNGVSFKVKNYNIEGTSKGLSKYFNLNTGNVSQCPWYAKYRAIEIVMSSSLDSKLKSKSRSVLNSASGNGNNWYAGTNLDLKYFKYSSDVTKPKAGSIVAWNINRHGYGHVGIIEKVYSDGSVLLSEGWNRFGENGSNGVNAIKIVTRKVSQDYLKTYGGQGSFIGYTYLFSYKS